MSSLLQSSFANKEMPAPYQLADCGSPLTLSDDYILPKDDRPLLSHVSESSTIPVIDMHSNFEEDGDPKFSMIGKMVEACEEYGFFRIINHGVSEELLRRMMALSTDFFGLPVEVRARLYSTDRKTPVRVTNPFCMSKEKGKVRLWSEYLFMSCSPSEDFFHLLPEKPAGYREIAAEYAKEMGELIRRILGFLSQGLGLKVNHLQEMLGKHTQALQVNFFPPCPEPELTIGLHCHTDLGVITVVQQMEGVTGLQIMKEGKWLAVHPVPGSLVVNVADQLQIMSNGRFKSVHHRVVNNTLSHRLSIAAFYRPCWDAIIGPANELVDEQQPALYRNYRFEEFFKEFWRQEGMEKKVKEAFEIAS